MEDYMSGINDALARNEAVGQEQQSQKPKFDIGKFLVAWAGSLGDSLTGNPVYANAVQSRQKMDEEARDAQARAAAVHEGRQYDAAEWDRRRRAGNQDPPGIAREVGWIQGLPDTERQAVMGMIAALRPGMQAPVVLPYGAELEGGPQPAQSGGNIPTVSSPEQAALLPPGTKFRTTDGRFKIVPGGQSAPPAGGFLSPY